MEVHPALERTSIDANWPPISQNNCDGSFPSQTITIEQSIAHTADLGSTISINTDGTAGIPGLGQVQIGVALGANYGVSYGTTDSMSQSISLQVDKGLRKIHHLVIHKWWDTGDLVVSSNTYHYKFLTSFTMELMDSETIPCASTGPTLASKATIVASTPPPKPSSVPIIVGQVVASSGTGTLRGTWFFDFDKGVEATSGDVWWDQQTNVARRLVPQGGARIANIGLKDFDSISRPQLGGLSYGTTPISGNADATNQLVPGDVFAVATRGGRFAKVKVVQYGYNLQLQWVTYAP